MNTASLPKRPRGRPSKHGLDYANTKDILIRRGVEMLTEQGMHATSLDELMKSVQIPKGSFYHYFPNKDAFVLAILDAYQHYFIKKLHSFLSRTDLTPIERMDAFVKNAGEGMQRYDFKRGCLVGNLGQEVSYLPPEISQRLEDIFKQWEFKIAQCLEELKEQVQYQHLNCERLAYQFWIGWEGAILRARLVKSTKPLDEFYQLFKLGVLGQMT